MATTVEQATHLLVLDAGTASLRAAVFDGEGHCLGYATTPWALAETQDPLMMREFDPEATWAAMTKAARRALEEAGVRPETIKGIAATGQRDGCVLLDDEGHELCCALNRDARGVAYADEIADDFGQRVFRTTGRWPLGLDVLERLWWFRRERNRTYRRIAHFLMIADWLTYRLSGALCSEPTSACSSLLFDIQRRSWALELADAIDVPVEVFPSVVAPGTAAGSLRGAPAEELGLPEGIPVVVAAADTQAAALGCGALEEGDTVAVAGTTMPILTVLTEPRLDPARRLQTGVHPLADRWILEANAGLAGAIYRWFAETFTGPEPDYARLEEEANAAQPGEVLAAMGPQPADFSTLRIPPPSVLRFRFLGMLDEPPRRGAFARAIMENVAYAIKANLEQLEAAADRPVTSLHLCGGLSRSSLLAQIVADVCQRPVHVPSVRQASWLGTAICAAVGVGLYPDLRAATRAMVRHEAPIEPSINARRYRGLYAHWQALLEKASNL